MKIRLGFFFLNIVLMTIIMLLDFWFDSIITIQYMPGIMMFLNGVLMISLRKEVYKELSAKFENEFTRDRIFQLNMIISSVLIAIGIIVFFFSVISKLA
ncbi:hypothetical protein [Clostridium sp. UBA4548]|uniref:hypothetical protein n=1 Tax=Clostridium sp. UBA4548 TaxID=1946361 RepID=UPI0025C4C620|nr:hypothetical protein [Clostridium sp. UBA4548]